MICSCTSRRQLVPHLVGAVGAVQQERGARLGHRQHVDPLQEVELVAGDERSPGGPGTSRLIGRGLNRRCETVTEPALRES